MIKLAPTSTDTDPITSRSRIQINRLLYADDKCSLDW